MTEQYQVSDVLHDSKLADKCFNHYIYPYKHISVVTDVVVLYTNDSENYYKKDPNLFKVLLIRRKNEPWAGQLALPGGFVNFDEQVNVAAQRELKEETGLDLPKWRFYQQGVYDQVDRDPRGRVISHSYSVLIVNNVLPDVQGLDDALEAGWFPLNDVVDFNLKLACDHTLIILGVWYNLKKELDV